MMTKCADLNWIKHPARTMQQLIDARKTFDDREMKDAIEVVLDQRYPHWQSKDSRIVASGHKTPTYAQFRGKQKTFTTSKNAYIWVVEKMLNTSPNLTLGDAVFKEMFINGTHGAQYLCRAPEELFPAKSKDYIRAKKDILWHELPNGWILNLNLSNKQKFDRLCNLAAVCDLGYEKDWSWHVEGEEESDLFDFDEIFAQVMLDSKA